MNLLLIGQNHPMDISLFRSRDPAMPATSWRPGHRVIRTLADFFLEAILTEHANSSQF